jgi:hypothetical protein
MLYSCTFMKNIIPIAKYDRQTKKRIAAECIKPQNNTQTALAVPSFCGEAELTKISVGKLLGSWGVRRRQTLKCVMEGETWCCR